MDFDRLIQSLKVQFLNSANTINQLELSKVNISEYENQIDIINQNIEELNNKMDNINQINLNNQKNKILNKNIFESHKEENEIDNDEGIDQKLNIFRDEIYNEIEKINLKILNELKNQADDIKIIYQELNKINNINLNINQINKNKLNKNDMNLEL